jgi:DNA-binding IclR family transcriptional regulator
MAKNIQSLERAAAMLRLLAGGERRLGLSDIASSLDLAKGTAHGILRTLQAEGFVEQDAASGRYQLGAELLRLGNSYLDVHELRARALVWTDDLARSSGESVHLGVLHQHGVLIVHHVFRPDDSRQVLEVGAMHPLHSSALGKVLAANDPVAHTEALEVDRKAFTSRTVTGLEEFEAVLDHARARGRRRRADPRPAPDARGRGRHHGRRGADLRGRRTALRAGRGGAGLCPRGVARPRRRAVLTALAHHR